jgi:hypothetical protein
MRRATSTARSPPSWGSFDIAGMLMQIGWTLVPPSGAASA